MSYTIRGRRVAYDNIAVGAATGQERTKGTLTSEVLALENFVAGSAAVRTTDALDHLITVTGGKTTVDTDETMINTN